MYIKEEYCIYYKDEQIGYCYVMSDRRVSYYARQGEGKHMKEIKKLGLDKDIRDVYKKDIPVIFGIRRDKNRVPGTRRKIWTDGDLMIKYIPRDCDKFWIYRRSAEKGEEGYSEKDHSAPHWEGPKTPEGMREWASWYCFNKKDDGMFEAELDEAWWWGGGHNDGGTIRTEVPEEWLDLPYDEFLEKVVTLSAAAHYNFTAEDLRETEGLKEFFGFK